MITASSLVVRPIAYRDPSVAFAPLADEPFAVLLDGLGGAQSRFAYIAINPFETMCITPETARTDPFSGLRQRLARYRIVHDDTELPAPFIGGGVGFVVYEIGHDLERLPPRKPKVFPFDLAFGFYDVIAVFDVKHQKAWIVSTGFPETTDDLRSARADARAMELSQKLGASPLPAVVAAPGGTWTAAFNQATYSRKAETIIEYIRAGDIFQANLTQRWAATWPKMITPFDMYRRLLSLSAAPFAAFLSLDAATQIISASPERFISIDHRGVVETRPIKGTRARGLTTAEDNALAAELLASPKDRAENLMIVDLLRNDLSRVCRVGSVAVPSLSGLETFHSVHHLVSVVTGQLRPECTAVDLLAACFPGGSITGAPKIRAMEIIHDLEPVARGPYCGSVVWMGFDGAMDSSIIIRTLIRNGDQLFAHAGGGIVADSDPTQEYAESVLKAQPLLAALTDHELTCASV